MILQNISKAIREQNYYAVALEFVIVIAGVVIGFQINAWNEARVETADEAVFLINLHSDIMSAEAQTERLRERRLGRLADNRATLDVLFERSDRDFLTDDECIILGSGQILTINTPGFTAFEELSASGRLNIISDELLRRSLVDYQQSRDALRELIRVLTTRTHDLAHHFPELISAEAYFDSFEIRNDMECDLDGMRANSAFLTKVSQNADAYDAYVRDGLRPWSDQLDRVHARVDELLSLNHGDGSQ